jgi:DNA-binding SARP family transcriptional activator/tetratricopeptide (TPR) repeat protein
MATVNLALLGGLRFQTDPGKPVPLSTKKAGALLAYLALHPGEAQARPKLAAMLWGDRSEARARDSLRQALSLLRKALSSVDPGALKAHEDTISFAPTALTTDAILFGNLVEQPEVENLEQAITLYRGEFLEGFQVLAPEFESWATAERERLREMALEAMTKLLAHHLSGGAVERGIRIAARLLAADPLQEHVHRTLMELYCRQGRQGAALRQYRTCADLLAKELGLGPDAKTNALRRDILRAWNQLRGTTSNGEFATQSLREVEIEPQVTPRLPERRQVTVLVCDLEGVSAIAARLDPEELQALVRAYERCCTPIILRSGGAVGKLAGAEMLAYFGYPQAHEHDVECAVRAGLSLVEAVSKLDYGNAGPLQLRVGIATGAVVVGDLLGDGSDRHGIIGEAAQLAGSLERVADPNAVVMAASTRQLVGNLFDCDDLGLRVLNGFPEPVPAWRVLAPSGIVSRFEALHAPTPPLIGRDEELELLLRRWRQAANGDGRVVLLAGEPGIGKSRLAVELLERLRGDSHAYLRYSCSPHHQDSTLYPITSQLQRAAGFRRGDTNQQRLDKLDALLAQATDEIGNGVPLIANLLSVPTDSRYQPPDLTPQKRKEKTLLALLAQLEGLAARQPVLTVFGDVHWIDSTSLELLDLVIDRVANLRGLLIVTFRPGFAHPWIDRPHVTLLTLNRLSRGERADMIAGVTGGKALPQEITDQIIDRTDGVPLFIEELTKSVVESGLLTETNERHALTGPVARLSIPSTLQGSLLARLDRLPATREVVQIGAALGRSFSHELISAVAQTPEHQVDDALAQLVSAEIVFRRGSPPDAEYTFKHALVQDVAYGTLLRSRCQQLHGQIAATLEAQFAEIVETQPQVLARHCTEAGLVQKAVGYWRKAAQQAWARSAMMEAVAQLQRGLDLVAGLPDDPWRRQQELDLLIALGRALMAAKGHSAPEVARTIARARALAERVDRPEHLLPLLYLRRHFHVVRAEHNLALSIAERIEKIGEGQNDESALVLGRYLRGHSSFALGEFATARALFEQCGALRDSAHRTMFASLTVGDPHATCLAYLALGLAFLGYIDQARVRMDEALADARRIDSYTRVWILNTACGVETIAGLACEAREHAEQVVALSNEHGFTYWMNMGLLAHGRSLTGLGQAQAGLALVSRGLSGLRATGAIVNTPWALCLLAEAYAKVRQFDDGLQCFVEALQLIDTTDERWWEAELHRLRGDLLIAKDDQAAAEQSYRQAMAVAKRQRAKTFELGAATRLAQLWRDQGKRDEARDLLAPIYSWFTEGLDTPLLRDARAVLEQQPRRGVDSRDR